MRDRLIIVDKDPFDCLFYEKSLSEFWEIQLHMDLRRVPDSIQSAQDVLLCDLEEPHMTTLLKLRSLQDRFRISNPIVVMTKHNAPELELTAREMGVHYYLIKPFSFQELKDAVASAFKIANE